MTLVPATCVVCDVADRLALLERNRGLPGRLLGSAPTGT